MEGEYPVRRIMIPMLLAVAIVVFGSGYGKAAMTKNLKTASELNYWERPLRLTKGPMGLLPEDCKTCHALQYAPWSGSLHSRSTGPGLFSQLAPSQDPAFAESCFYCHAPAMEQKDFTLDKDGYIKNPLFSRSLQGSGVSCAVCHLRRDIINGPAGPTLALNKKTAPHQGLKKKIFKDSLFCSACHQLDNGFELNGKPLTNTYGEWKESPFAAKNIHCQNCHMPEGRHLFLGIHDKDTVRGALDIKIKKTKGRGKGSGLLNISLKNTGAGHYLPSYVTPLIVVKSYIIDNSSKKIQKTLQKDLIGRVITLDLTEEIMDTRIAPGRTHTIRYRPRYPEKTKGPLRAVVEIRVYPDDFYNRFFREALKEGAYSSKALMEEALEATELSPYLLFKETIELD